MGIRFLCPNGHKLNVKAFQAGRRGICPFCGVRFQIPLQSTLAAGQPSPAGNVSGDAGARPVATKSEGTEFERELELQVQQPQEAIADEAASEIAAVPSGRTSEPVHSASPGAKPESGGRPVVTDPASTEGSVDRRPGQQQWVPAAPLQTAPVMADPLSEMPNAVWYVRPPSGGQFGPAQSAMMRNWLSEGRVSSETLVWREGWADWQEAGAVFPELQPASVLPESPPLATGGERGGGAVRTGPGRRKRGPNIGLIVVLVAAVVLLLVVLILILTGALSGSGKGNGNRAGQGPSVTIRERLDGAKLCRRDDRMTG